MAQDRYDEARRRARVRFDYAETEELAAPPTIKVLEKLEKLMTALLRIVASLRDAIRTWNCSSGCNIAGALVVVFEKFAVIGVFLLVISLPIYGLLRLGIYIGAHRAVDNIVFGFMSAGRDHSELPEEMRILQSAIANRNCWYGLFGVSKADWNKNKITADIGGRLDFLAFEGGRLFQQRMEEM